MVCFSLEGTPLLPFLVSKATASKLKASHGAVCDGGHTYFEPLAGGDAMRSGPAALTLERSWVAGQARQKP